MIVPFILLFYWNYHTCKKLLRRRGRSQSILPDQNPRINNHSTAAELLNGNRSNTDTITRVSPEQGIAIYILEIFYINIIYK